MTRKGDFMNISIRSHIINNFKNTSIDDIKSSILASVEDKDELTLPGLGVFFELLWSNCSEKQKNEIVEIINNSLKKA